MDKGFARIINHRHDVTRSTYLEKIYHLPPQVAWELAKSDATQAQLERIALHIMVTMTPRPVMRTPNDTPGRDTPTHTVTP